MPKGYKVQKSCNSAASRRLRNSRSRPARVAWAWISLVDIERQGQRIARLLGRYPRRRAGADRIQEGLDFQQQRFPALDRRLAEQPGFWRPPCLALEPR